MSIDFFADFLGVVAFSIDKFDLLDCDEVDLSEVQAIEMRYLDHWNLSRTIDTLMNDDVPLKLLSKYPGSKARSQTVDRQWMKEWKENIWISRNTPVSVYRYGKSHYYVIFFLTNQYWFSRRVINEKLEVLRESRIGVHGKYLKGVFTEYQQIYRVADNDSLQQYQREQQIEYGQDSRGEILIKAKQQLKLIKDRTKEMVMEMCI